MFIKQYISLRYKETVFCHSSCELIGVSDLLSTHEAIFLLEVNVVDGKTLLSAGLIMDAAIRTPHHTTLTTSHL